MDQNFYFHEPPGEGVGEKSQFILWREGFDAHRVGRGKLLSVLRKPETCEQLKYFLPASLSSSFEIISFLGL